MKKRQTKSRIDPAHHLVSSVISAFVLAIAVVMLAVSQVKASRAAKSGPPKEATPEAPATNRGARLADVSDGSQNRDERRA